MICFAAQPYGVNAPGITFKLSVTDFAGVKHIFAAPQLPQAAQPSLPYALLGLGSRIGGYIDSVVMGLPRPGAHTNSWTGVVPNAVLVAVPYPLDSAAEWSLLLFVSPAGRNLLWTFTAVVVTLVLSGGAALVFKLRERAADSRERTVVGRVFF